MFEFMVNTNTILIETFQIPLLLPIGKNKNTKFEIMTVTSQDLWFSILLNIISLVLCECATYTSKIRKKSSEVFNLVSKLWAIQILLQISPNYSSDTFKIIKLFVAYGFGMDWWMLKMGGMDKSLFSSFMRFNTLIRFCTNGIFIFFSCF